MSLTDTNNNSPDTNDVNQIRQDRESSLTVKQKIEQARTKLGSDPSCMMRAREELPPRGVTKLSSAMAQTQQKASTAQLSSDKGSISSRLKDLDHRINSFLAAESLTTPNRLDNRSEFPR